MTSLAKYGRSRRKWSKNLWNDQNLKVLIRTQDSMMRTIHTIMIYKNGRCSNWLTINALNASVPTSEEWRTASEHSKKVKNTNLRNLYAVNVQQLVLELASKIVRNTVQTTSSSSANSAAPSLNGSAGATRISVNPVTRSKWMVIMCLGRRKPSCLSAMDRPRVH